MSNKTTVTMMLDRNKAVRSTTGHMLNFFKDEPLEVPLILVRTCAEMGAKRVDGIDPLPGDDEASTPTQPTDPGQRLMDIAAAMDVIADKNEREDFTASSSPTVVAVSREVGYRVDRIEVVAAWRQRAEDNAAE